MRTMINDKWTIMSSTEQKLIIWEFKCIERVEYRIFGSLKVFIKEGKAENVPEYKNNLVFKGRVRYHVRYFEWKGRQGIWDYLEYSPQCQKGCDNVKLNVEIH